MNQPMSEKRPGRSLSPEAKRRRKELLRLFLWIGISLLLVWLGTSLVYHLYWGLKWDPLSFLTKSAGILPQ